MKFIIELEKNSEEADWNASLQVGNSANPARNINYVGVEQTPELALSDLLAFPQVQELFKARQDSVDPRDPKDPRGPEITD